MHKSVFFGIAAVLLATTAATATPTTFGQFVEKGTGKTFRYINQDVVKRGVIKSTGAEIISVVKGGAKMASPTVTFTSGMNGKFGIMSGDVISAALTFDAKATGAAIDVGNGFYQQLFDGSFSFMDIANGKDLVTATFTGAVLNASGKAFSLSINGNNSSGTGTLTYTSDVFTLGMTDDFTFAATALSRPIAYTKGHAFNYKQGFTGDLTGTLSSVLVPEPAMIGLFGLGLLGLGAARSRRR